MEYLIKNGTVFTMKEGKYKEKADILVQDGKIKLVGEISSADYPSATVIDASNCFVTPGFVEAHCHIGIGEANVGRVGQDYNEITDPITPELRGYDAIKPLDPHFDTALKHGITTVTTGPGSANLIGGTFCVLKTNTSEHYDKRVLVKEVAMKMALGENPKRCYESKSIMTRMANAAKLREALTRAKMYHDAVAKYNDVVEIDEDAKRPEYNPKWESLMRVFDGFPVKIHAHQHDDILTALRIIKEFGLNATIEHATEGWMILDELKEANQKVCCGPIFIDTMKWEVRNVNRKSPKLFSDNNIEFALITDGPVVPMDGGQTFQVALAMKEGLTEEEALRSITTTPAKFLGVSDRVGKIEEGMDADLTIWTRLPYDSLSESLYVFVNGKVEYKK